MNEICNICGRPIADHEDGLACCKHCGGPAVKDKTFKYDGEVHCPHCDLWGFTKDDWNLQPQVSPWIFAPLPKEGEEQTFGRQILTVFDKSMARTPGYWEIMEGDTVWHGYNGGEPRTETRYWKDGKLVYEREE